MIGRGHALTRANNKTKKKQAAPGVEVEERAEEQSQATTIKNQQAPPAPAVRTATTATLCHDSTTASTSSTSVPAASKSSRAGAQPSNAGSTSQPNKKGTGRAHGAAFSRKQSHAMPALFTTRTS